MEINQFLNIFLININSMNLSSTGRFKKISSKIVTYPTAGVHGGSDRPVGEIDQFSDIVDVGVGAVREHGAAAWESEPVFLVPNPILFLLLHR